MIFPMNASEQPSRARKKRGPLFWVLIGVASFFLLLLIAGGILSYLALRSLEQRTGMDVKAMKEHPVRAYVLSNPDNEILSEDSSTGEARYRNQKTGQEFTIKIDPATNRFITIPVTSDSEKK